MLLHQLLENAAANRPDRPVLVGRDFSLTYGALNHRANRCAGLMRRRGLKPGDRVVIALENGVDMVTAYFGAMKAGGVAVPLPPGPRSDRLPAVIADCAPHITILDEATAQAFVPRGILDPVPHVLTTTTPTPDLRVENFAAACEDCAETPLDHRGDPADLAAIIYTSGSTGEPRGVMLSHGNFVANAESIVEYLGLTADDKVMCVLPFSYVYGLSLLHTHVAVGGSIVIENRVAFPNVVLDAMAGHGVTGFAGVPSTFALMLHRSSLDEVRLPKLRYVTQAGGAMSSAKIDDWLRRGPPAEFYVMYGATEAAARLSYLPPRDLVSKRGSIGRPIPGVELRVLSEEGEEAGSGQLGELVARGPNIARGYWNRPQETAERFGPEGYRTGDLGYADADGYFYIVGRRHDMIKVGANRVGAREIEDVLHLHPSVHEAAVVAVPHDLLGEAPVAIVSLTGTISGVDPELRAFCAAHLAAYKVPVRVMVVTELPKLASSGKLDRVALRRLAVGADDVTGHVS